MFSGNRLKNGRTVRSIQRTKFFTFFLWRLSIQLQGVLWIAPLDYQSTPRKIVRHDGALPCVSCQGGPDCILQRVFPTHSDNLPARETACVFLWGAPCTKEGGSMPAQPSYHLKGHLVGACNCDWGCP
jgi:hypothetical protein